jgi:TonB family protein
MPVSTMNSMCWRHLLCLAVIFVMVFKSQLRASDWLSAPKPKFPRAALTKGSEGSVRLRVILAPDGSVKQAIVSKSSGDAALDATAQQAVLRWKMNASAIKPTDLTKGRKEVIDFRQEAPIVARYPDRIGAFGSKSGVIGETPLSVMWIFAPFPSYPFEARQRHEQGNVFIGLTVGRSGRPENIKLLKSSGYPILDQAALRAIPFWLAHKEYAGRKVVFPIGFQVTRRYR